MQSGIIIALNSSMASSSSLIILIPILADIFVFSYPIYLIYLYFFTKDKLSRWERIWHNTSNRQYKYNAINIFLSVLGSFAVNYIIKFFIEEQRPYRVLNLAFNPKESLMIKSIPSDTFPSDHAAIGMTIAISILILAYRAKDKRTIIFGRIFLGFAMIMNISRITMGVHRPIDIIGGSIVGAMIAYIITLPTIYTILSKRLYNPIIDFQEHLFNKRKVY